MIYITGDTHADFNRFSTKNFPEQKEMTKDDYVIICGDFGGIWNYLYSDKTETYWLKWLEDKPFTILFVDGNHENFDRLSKEFKVVNYHGGNAHRIRSNIYHLMRGYVFEFEGKKFFTFGGASSHDIQDGILKIEDYATLSDLVKDYNKRTRAGQMLRIDHISWWEKELPSYYEMQRGRINLKVFYRSDNDGKCAGYWVKKLNRLKDNYTDEYIKINYGMDFPFDSIGKDEIVYIVDYSISPDEMDKLLEITKNIIWIDHHKSAIEKYSNYDKKIAGLRYDGIAGCMLTYIYLNYMTDEIGEIINEFDPEFAKTAPWFTKLIADYDVWSFDYGEKTREFQKGFELCSHDPEEKIWGELLYEEGTAVSDEQGILTLPILDRIISNGKTIIKYRKNMMVEYCKNKCFVINMAMISSDDFVIDNIDDYDILIGFFYDGENWNYSLRSTKYELTYNGDKNEIYFDAYKKFENQCIQIVEKV